MWRARQGDDRSSRHEERYRLIADIGRIALSDEALTSLFDQVVVRLQQALDTDYCGILERHESGGLSLASGSGRRSAAPGQLVLESYEASPAGLALARGEPVVVTDFDRETRFPRPAYLARCGAAAGLSVAILGKDQHCGVLEAYAQEPRPLAEAEVNTVLALAHILGEAIRRKDVEDELQAANSRLEQRILERSEALLEANVRLRQSEELFRALFDGAVAGVVLTDLDGRILEANAAFAGMLEYERDSLLQKRLWDLLHGQDTALQRQLFEELVSGERQNYQLERRCLTRKGTSIWVHVATSVVRDAAGRPLCTLATVQDTSARKEAELALRASQEQFQTIFRSGPMATCINTVAEGRILDVNAQFERILGYRRNDVIGKTISDLRIWVRPELRASLLLTIERRGYARNVEFDAYDKAGATRTLLASFERIRLAGDDHLLAMFEDVTEKKRLENDLSEARLKLADLRERERLKLARELHDGAVQQLIGISYAIDQTQKGAARLGSERLNEELGQHRGYVLGVVRQLRDLIGDLRPAGLQELGLATTLENYVSTVRGDMAPGGPSIELELALLRQEPTEAIAVCLVRVTQEALRNAIKHACARRIRIVLGCDEETISLTISDDGRGFAPPEALGTLAKDDHFGLIGMQERVSSVGGELVLHSVPGQGTSVSLWVPLESEEQHV